MNAMANSVVPVVDCGVLAACAACVFDLPESVTVDDRRAAIRIQLMGLPFVDEKQHHALATAIDARLEAFCRAVKSPLVKAWLRTDTGFVEHAFQIAAFAPVITAGEKFEFDHRIFFSLLLARVVPAGSA